MVDNWNDCLKDVTGDYVICMGDDDLLAPGCLQAYAELAGKYPQVDVFHAWTAIIDETGRMTDVLPKHAEVESVYSYMRSLWRGDRQFMGDVMIRTSTLRDMDGYYWFPYAWHSDHITTYLAAAPHGIVNMQQIGFYYRENAQSVTNSACNARQKVLADFMARIWYEVFLALEADDAVDRAIRDAMSRELDRWYEKAVAYDIAVSMRRRPWRILSWMRRRFEFNLSSKILLRAAMLSLCI